MVMRSSLVLNASYEPLSVVSARRAACLVLAEKAELVECDGLLIRSASLTLASPLVIRLRYMVKVPYRRKASLSRRGVFARDDYRCQYCGAHADSIDHVTPRSRGGRHEWENVAAACRPCNLAKRDRTPDEAGMRLLRPCRVPRATAWVVVSTTRVPEAWKPYLALAS
jgi:5-methylcytosine-specific restriction endonuclease McrA